MANIGLVSDTTSDLPREIANKYDIHLADAYVHFGTQTFTVGELSKEQFFDKLEKADKDTFPTTSQAKANNFLEIYEKLKQKGYSTILSVHVDSKLSGTINSANIAKGMIDGIDIRIISSQGVSAQLMAVVLEARKLIDDGQKVDAIEKKLKEFSSSLSSYFTVKTLDYLVKGGRMSQIKYFLGNLLNIKPIIRLSDGSLEAYDKARGVEGARNKVYSIVTQNYKHQDQFRYIIAYTQDKQIAKDYEEKLQEEYPQTDGLLVEIGPVVAAHGGPGVMLMLTYK